MFNCIPVHLKQISLQIVQSEEHCPHVAAASTASAFLLRPQTCRFMTEGGNVYLALKRKRNTQINTNMEAGFMRTEMLTSKFSRQVNE